MDLRVRAVGKFLAAALTQIWRPGLHSRKLGVRDSTDAPTRAQAVPFARAARQQQRPLTTTRSRPVHAPDDVDETSR